MPVEFQCPSCHQRLSVGRKKAGQQVDCPKCEAAVAVPTLDEAAAVSVMAESIDTVVNGNGSPDFSSVASLDEVKAVPAAGIRTDWSDDRQRSGTVPRQTGTDLPRSTIVAVALLLLVAVLIGFIAGLLVGGRRSEASASLAAVDDAVLIEGHVTSQLPNSRPGGDAGAVIILLPVRSRPDVKIDGAGLAPAAPPPEADAASLAAIRQLGGVYQRADEQGQFRMVVPRAGEYRMLIVSGNARRRAGAEPERDDLITLGRTFRSGRKLIGPQKYVYLVKRVSAGEQWYHDFGLSGK